MSDPVARINSMKSRLDKISSDAAHQKGRIAVLREQYEQKKLELPKFGVNSIEELRELVAKWTAELEPKAEKLERLASLFEAGDYQSVIDESSREP